MLSKNKKGMMMRKLLLLLLLGAIFLISVQGVSALSVIDDFDRVDATTLGGNWTTPSGTWNIGGNEANASSDAADDRATLHTDNLRNFNHTFTYRYMNTAQSGSWIWWDALADTGYNGFGLRIGADTGVSIRDGLTSKNTTAFTFTSGGNYTFQIEYNISSSEEMRVYVWENKTSPPASATVAYKALSATGHFIKMMNQITLSNDGQPRWDNLLNTTNPASTPNTAPTLTNIIFNQTIYRKNEQVNVSVNYTDIDANLGTLRFNISNSTQQLEQRQVTSVSSGALVSVNFSSYLWEESDALTISVEASDGTTNATIRPTNTTTINNTIPTITINDPPDGDHNNQTLVVNFTIFDVDKDDTFNVTLYVNSTTSGNVSKFSLLNGTIYNITAVNMNNGNFTWFLEVNDSMTTRTTERTFVKDTVKPVITWITPFTAPLQQLYSKYNLSLNLSVFDDFLFRVNITVRNVTTGNYIYSELIDNIDNQNKTKHLNRTITFANTGNISLEIASGDSHTFGDLKNKTAIINNTEVVKKGGNTYAKATHRDQSNIIFQDNNLNLILQIGNYNKNAIPVPLLPEFNTTVLYDSINEEFKFTYNFTVKMNDGRMFINVSNTIGDYIYIINGSRGHILTKDTYLDFQDLRDAGFNVTTTRIADNNVEIQFWKDGWLEGQKIEADPVAGSLNTQEETVNFFYDIDAPLITIQSPTPSNNSRTVGNSVTINITFTDETPLNSGCILQLTNSTGTSNYSMARDGLQCQVAVGTNDGVIYYYNISVNDTAWNNARTVERLFRENTAPVITLSTANGTISGNRTFELNWTASDAEEDPRNYTLYINGTYNMSSNTSNTSFTIPANLINQQIDWNIIANDSYETTSIANRSIMYRKQIVVDSPVLGVDRVVRNGTQTYSIVNQGTFDRHRHNITITVKTNQTSQMTVIMTVNTTETITGFGVYQDRDPNQDNVTINSRAENISLTLGQNHTNVSIGISHSNSSLSEGTYHIFFDYYDKAFQSGGGGGGGVGAVVAPQPLQLPSGFILNTTVTQDKYFFAEGENVEFIVDFYKEGQLHDPKSVLGFVFDEDGYMIMEKIILDKVETGRYKFSKQLPQGVYTIKVIGEGSYGEALTSVKVVEKIGTRNLIYKADGTLNKPLIIISTIAIGLTLSIIIGIVVKSVIGKVEKRKASTPQLGF